MNLIQLKHTDLEKQLAKANAANEAMKMEKDGLEAKVARLKEDYELLSSSPRLQNSSRTSPRKVMLSPRKSPTPRASAARETEQPSFTPDPDAASSGGVRTSRESGSKRRSAGGARNKSSIDLEDDQEQSKRKSVKAKAASLVRSKPLKI